MVRANVLLQNYCPTNTNTKYKKVLFIVGVQSIKNKLYWDFYQHLSFLPTLVALDIDMFVSVVGEHKRKFYKNSWEKIKCQTASRTTSRHIIGNQLYFSLVAFESYSGITYGYESAFDNFEFEITILNTVLQFV